MGQPLIEIRSISQSGSANAARFALKNIEDAVQHAQAMNANKQNRYMCINPIDPIIQILAGQADTDTDILAAF